MYFEAATCENVKKLKWREKKRKTRKAMMCGSPHTTRRGHSFYKKKFKKKVFIKGQRQGMSIEGTVIGEREPTEGSLSYSTDELKNRYYTLDPNEIVSVSPGRTLSVPRDATSSQCCR